MGRGKAEDAGGLTPAKDDNAAPYHFDPRTLPIFKCVDYNYEFQLAHPLSVARLEKGSGIILPSFDKIRKFLLHNRAASMLGFIVRHRMVANPHGNDTK